jgi:hypothetical protein
MEMIMPYERLRKLRLLPQMPQDLKSEKIALSALAGVASDVARNVTIASIV